MNKLWSSRESVSSASALLKQRVATLSVYIQIMNEYFKYNKSAYNPDSKASKKAATQLGANESTMLFDEFDLSDAAIEAFFNSEDDEIAMEGQNLDAKDIKKSYHKEIKTLAKDAKSLYKTGNYSAAKAKYTEAANLCDKMVAEIDKLEPSVGSAVIGYFAYGFIYTAKSILYALPTLGLGAYVVAIKEVIDEIRVIITNIKKLTKGEEITASDFNMYINRLKLSGKDLAKHYRNAAKRCDKPQTAAETFIAIEQFEEVYNSDVAIEAFFNSDDADLVAMEGQNLDARNIKKSYGKEIKALAKEANSLYKAGDYSKAKAKYTEAAKLADTMVAEVDKLEPSVGSAVLGYFAQNLVVSGKSLLLCLPTLGLGSMYVELKEMIEKVIDVVNIIKKLTKGEEINASDFNRYVNAIKSSGKDLAAKYRNAAKRCDKPQVAEEAFLAMEQFDDIESGDIAMEANAVTIDDACTIGILATYAAFAVWCVKKYFTSSQYTENKYIKVLQKELKPQLKAAVKKANKAKREKRYDDAIAACKEIIALHEKIVSEVESLGRDIKVSKTTDEEGKVTTKSKTLYGEKSIEVLNETKDQIDRYKALIKLLEAEKRKHSPKVAEEAYENGIYEGYKRAFEEFFGLEDEDLDDEE